ncbi:S8 family peptidase [Actinoalloteichus fjordicus]|uniref:Subtilase family protease/peptidase inhibitor I9 n=1 Tax=Actinoalloteichus fjordicus TaxID=1612552 RepID=A0AAC9LAS2_9PSEU|nr:S8 family peptidase [Actinoalloteichus fjordicus]APU13494.1 subtilase family protease/peptidase inhibitor I9 [Actinoalloteichus fjordicus]
MVHHDRRRWAACVSAVTVGLMIGTASVGTAAPDTGGGGTTSASAIPTGTGAAAEAGGSGTGLDEERGGIRAAASPTAIRGSYLVVLPDTLAPESVRTAVDSLIAVYGGKLRHTFEHSVRGFSVELDQVAARLLAADPAVAFVEQNQTVSLTDTQLDPTWGLDRIDQRELPLDQSYTYGNTALSVNAYVIDTGVQPTHVEFDGRAVAAFDAIGDGRDGADCNGHGTHVAGTIGGTEYGVAKEVAIQGVRVLDCGGSGTIEGVLQGIEWVTANAEAPSVANMSLGGGVSEALDAAVAESIASGITYVVAAGNDNEDACNASPARTPTALTVAASDDADVRASFSNLGECVDLFAPGVDITSAWIGADDAINTINGTSMASPHVAGAVALYLEADPDATPGEVAAVTLSWTTSDVITDAGEGTPNRLLYTGG